MVLISAVNVSDFDAVFFHCPFTRLVQKAIGVLAFIDYKRGLSKHLTNLERAKPSELDFYLRLLSILSVTYFRDALLRLLFKWVTLTGLVVFGLRKLF